MKNQLLSNLNKKVMDYSVSRKAIERCASEGYEFASKKIEVNSDFMKVTIGLLFAQLIVQAVEIYIPSRTKGLLMKKVSRAIDRVKIETFEFDYTYQNYFSTSDLNKKLAVIKVTTFDIPKKHIERISSYSNNFNDLTHYLVSVPIVPLTDQYPDYKINEADPPYAFLQFINCDQNEYRINQLMYENKVTDYYQFEAAIGKNRVDKLVREINQIKLNKIKALFHVNSNSASIHLNNENDDSYPLVMLWAHEEFSSRENKSIFEFSEDYISLVVHLHSQDLAELQKLKTAEEALQYLKSTAL